MTEKTTKLLFERDAEDALYVIDVSSFIFRAYYSVGYLSTANGTPTGAVFGVANMIVSLLKDHQPSHVIVAMDSKTPTFRKEIYPKYKANRPPPPDDLKVQFPFVQQLVEAFDLAVLQRDGFEADDIIATTVRVARGAGLKVVIVSADKDLMQLVDDQVVMLDTMKNKIWDEAAVEAKWAVPPKLLGDLLAIAGDSSDNIPGVPRVGPKTAAPLLVEFGGLEPLLASLDKLKSKALQKRMTEHSEVARLSRRLVALDDNVPIEFELEDARLKEPRAKVLGPVLEKFELTKLKERLFGFNEVVKEREPVYRSVTTANELEQIAEEIKQAGRFAVDLETTSINAVRAEIVGVALAWKPLEAVYIPVAHKTGDTLPLDVVLGIIGPLLEDPAVGVIAQNVKYEDTIFRRNNIKISNVEMDPMLASYLLRSDLKTHNLDVLAKEVLGRKTTSYDDVTQKSKGHQLLFDEVAVDNATAYAGEDAEIAFALANVMRPRIKEAGMDALLRDVELPLARVLCGMELQGVELDTDHLRKMSDDFGGQLLEIERSVYETAGYEFNLASPKQLQTLLFDKIGLPTQKKTKTGYSTDFEVLETLASMHSLPSLILEHRVLSKLKGTYLDALPQLVNPATGRIHTSFNQAVTATGRLSSSNPNLQNIPIRTERGRKIRRAFTAPCGKVLISADYSQVELRILAHLSKDPALVEAFKDGADVHKRTARALFGFGCDEEVPKEERSKAKAINFGVIYGKTDYSLAKELGIPRNEARRFIEGYFDLYKGVADFMDYTICETRKSCSVSTLLGRRRELRDINSSNHNIRQQAERMARNTPIQGSAADLIKVAMIRVDQRLQSMGSDVGMILTVHDELLLEVPEAKLEQVSALVKEEMEGAMDLLVPLIVDIGTGPNWAEAH